MTDTKMLTDEQVKENRERQLYWLYCNYPAGALIELGNQIANRTGINLVDAGIAICGTFDYLNEKYGTKGEVPE